MAICLYFGFFAGMLWIAGLIYSIHWITSHTLSHFNFNSNIKSSLQNIIYLADAPHWDQIKPFWTPIHISLQDINDPTITFCKLDFKTYWEKPNSYPMFRDLVRMSNCGMGNMKTARLTEVKANPELLGEGGSYIAPTGFVFHESRVGSTLVANSLGNVFNFNICLISISL